MNVTESGVHEYVGTEVRMNALGAEAILGKHSNCWTQIDVQLSRNKLWVTMMNAHL